ERFSRKHILTDQRQKLRRGRQAPVTAAAKFFLVDPCQQVRGVAALGFEITVTLIFCASPGKKPGKCPGAVMNVFRICFDFPQQSGTSVVHTAPGSAPDRQRLALIINLDERRIARWRRQRSVQKSVKPGSEDNPD